MQAHRLVLRGFRNLEDLDLAIPAAGAVITGANGHGKTNLLEALYYPVLYRSLRGAADGDVGRWGEPGFFLELTAVQHGGRPAIFAAGYDAGERRKRIAVDGVEQRRIAEAIGQWLAVSFLPLDLALIHGPAGGRRQYLDRVLALTDVAYLRALGRYRGALAQRNAALREGTGDRRWEAAHAFDPILEREGTLLLERRLAWVRNAGERFAAEVEGLGERTPMHLEYRGAHDPAEWPAMLARSAARDLARRTTTVGPHRDDLTVVFGDRPLREVGSRGQHRTGAIALKLLELDMLVAATGDRPALLLDDVFAELDRDRQRALGTRLARAAAEGHQIFITAPRHEELPPGLPLDLLDVSDGVITAGAEAGAP